jgi:enoyl-CoA hydratase/carnithine racemase
MPHDDHYRHAVITRHDDGVVEVRLHTDGGPLLWSPTAHAELPRLWTDVSDDLDIRVVILTGTGETFIPGMDSAGFMAAQHEWHEIWWEGRRLLQRLLDIDVPVIGVLNGPAYVHAELIFLSDIVLAADPAHIEESHVSWGTVPGDGVFAIWPHVLGPVRGKRFVLTPERITAQELLAMGAVTEVLPGERALERARELAHALATKPFSTLRFTRTLLADPLRLLLAQTLSHGLGLEAPSSRSTELQR